MKSGSISPPTVVAFEGNLFCSDCFYDFLSLLSCSFTYVRLWGWVFRLFIFFVLILLRVCWILKCMIWSVSSNVEIFEPFFLQLLPMSILSFPYGTLFRPFHSGIHVSYPLCIFCLFTFIMRHSGYFLLTYIPVVSLLNFGYCMFKFQNLLFFFPV